MGNPGLPNKGSAKDSAGTSVGVIATTREHKRSVEFLGTVDWQVQDNKVFKVSDFRVTISG